jgi:flagellin-specific chaperone FliS
MADIEYVARNPREGMDTTMAAAELPLEHYSPDDLLDMLREAGRNAMAATKRRIAIQEAIQHKLERISKEFMVIQEQHYGNGDETSAPDRRQY